MTAITLIIGLIIYFFQHKCFFHPEKLPADFKFAYDNLKAEEVTVEPEPGAKINYLHFLVDHPKGVVIYLKGNTKSIKGWGKFAIDFTRLGYEVVMMDYRGFGKSTGKRNVEAMKRDSQFIYNIVKKEFSEEKIVVYGRSLGTGSVSYTHLDVYKRQFPNCTLFLPPKLRCLACVFVFRPYPKL